MRLSTTPEPEPLHIWEERTNSAPLKMGGCSGFSDSKGKIMKALWLSTASLPWAFLSFWVLSAHVRVRG